MCVSAVAVISSINTENCFCQGFCMLHLEWRRINVVILKEQHFPCVAFKMSVLASDFGLLFSSAICQGSCVKAEEPKCNHRVGCVQWRLSRHAGSFAGDSGQTSAHLLSHLMRTIFEPHHVTDEVSWCARVRLKKWDQLRFYSWLCSALELVGPSSGNISVVRLKKKIPRTKSWEG